MAKNKKVDDRRSGTANLIYGDDLRELRREDLARWKRRLTRKVLAQKHDMTIENPLDEIYQCKMAENEAYDMVIKIISADWKNI